MVREMIEMTIVGLAIDPSRYLQVVWLWSLHDRAALPILIGDTEATAIYLAQADKPPPRPLTHDLIKTILDHFDAQVKEVQIVDLKDGIFYAEFVFSCGEEKLHLDARPSDAIALALKYRAPIYLSEAVLSQAGYTIKQTEEGVFYAEPLDRSQEPAVSEEAVKAAIDALLKEVGIEAFEESVEEIDDPKARLKVLERRMEQAIKLERYEEAKRIRKEIERIQGEQKDKID